MGQTKHDNVWHSGFTVLKNNDTLSGQIKYDFRQNVIHIKSNNEQRILLPGNFKSVSYIDSFDSTIHNLSVYYIRTTRDYTRPYFFEPIDTISKIKLVQQFYWEKGASNYGGSPFFSNSRTVKYTHLYYYHTEKVVKHIQLRKREVLKILKDKKNKIKSFAKEQNLRFNTTRSVLKIFKYYNSLYI